MTLHRWLRVAPQLPGLAHQQTSAASSRCQAGRAKRSSLAFVVFPEWIYEVIWSSACPALLRCPRRNQVAPDLEARLLCGANCYFIKRGHSRDDRQEEKCREDGQVHCALHYAGPAGREGDRGYHEGDEGEHRLLRRQPEREGQVRDDGDHGDGRDREADRGERRAEREVEARLHAVARRGAYRGD